MNAPANAVAKAAPTNDLRTLLSSDAMKRQLSMALPKVLPVDRFLRVLFTTLQRQPELLTCTRDSVLGGIMTAASLGLEIDPALGRFYLVPFKGAATAIIGYKGYIDLFYRSGQGAGLIAEAVYEKDHFVYQLGLESRLEHIPSDDADRGKLRYAYACATLTNGGKVWKVLNRTQVMAAKAVNSGSASKYSPWNNPAFEPQMWVKTAIRALSDFMPLSAELRDAVSADAAQEQAAYASAIEVPATVAADNAAADDAPAPADASAALTPRQRVNALMVEAGQLGAGDAAAAVLKKHGGEPAKMDESALKILAEDLSSVVRNAVEG